MRRATSVCLLLTALAAPAPALVERLTFLGPAFPVELIAAGPDGDVYIAGSRPVSGGGKMFVIRFHRDLQRMNFLVLHGGSRWQEASAMAVGPDGSTYLAGATDSVDFPVTPGAYLTERPGPTAGFVLKLDPAGQIAYGTFFPESEIRDIAVDSQGRAIVVGLTRSTEFPTTDDAVKASMEPIACSQSCRGSLFGITCHQILCSDGFISRLSADGSALEFSSYLGADPVDPDQTPQSFNDPDAEGDDWAAAVEVGPNGHIFVAGVTNSVAFPTTSGSAQASLAGEQDLFVLRLVPDGNAIEAGTLVGGEATETEPVLSLDPSGGVHMTASTFVRELRGLVTPDPPPDAIVLKLSPSLDQLVYLREVGKGFHVRRRHIPTPNPIRVVGAPDGGAYVASPGPFLPSQSRECLDQTYLTKLSPEGEVQATASRPFFGFELTRSPAGDLFLTGTAGGAFSAAVGEVFQPFPGSFNFPVSTTQRAPLVSRASSDIQSDPVRVDCVFNAAGRGVWPKNFGGVPTPAVRQDAVISPGELITLTGEGLGPEPGAVADLSAERLPEELARVSVSLDSNPAPLIWAQRNQINAAAPFSLGPVWTFVDVRTRDGPAPAFFLPTRQANPGVFTQDFSGTGLAVILNEDGTLNRPDNPASPGSVITFFATGIGLTGVRETAGVINRERRPGILRSGWVEIGGAIVDILEVTTAAGLPAGEYEIRAQVPDLPPGTGHWVALYVNPRAASQILATIAVE